MVNQWIENNKHFKGTLEDLIYRLDVDNYFITYEIWEQIPGFGSRQRGEYLWKVWNLDNINKTYELW